MAVVREASRADVEREVLQIVGDLVAELGVAADAPALDESLERDLGISSLERVERLLRLEQAFGVRLPDSVMADAASSDDLVSAILRGMPSAPDARPASVESASPGMPAPSSVRTLVDALQWHAKRTPDRIHIHLRRENGTETSITYSELLKGAAAVGTGLRALGVGRGERVALMLRTEQPFFPAFCGTLMAGAVPVPIYPPLRMDRIEE